MPDMIPLYAGNVKFINHLHLYKDDNPVEDALLICNTDNILLYCVMNRIDFTIVVRESLPYAARITELLSASYPHITRNIISLNKIMGLYDKETSIHKISTLFFVIDVLSLKEKHLVQMTIKNHDTRNPELTLIEGHQRVKYIYLDMLVKGNTIITDTKSSGDIDTYIMYINCDDEENVAKMWVEGLRVYVRNDEKEEFKAHNPSVVFPNTIAPVVDVWQKRHEKFFQLTDDVSRVKFNFSTGLGFLEFFE